MNATISPWGNSLGLRIPKVIAQTLHLSASDTVFFTIKDNSLIIKKKEKKSLDELLQKVTPKNIHKETQPSYPVGSEVW